jgi:hypothetical protein
MEQKSTLIERESDDKAPLLWGRKCFLGIRPSNNLRRSCQLQTESKWLLMGIPQSLRLFYFFFLKSLTFAWTAFSGFQSTGNIFPFLMPLIFAWTALSGFQSTGTLSIA